MDNSDACHFKKLLAETKQNGSYRISFLPTVLPNWCSLCTTFGISIITPASGPSENITSVMLSYGLHLCRLAQELRRTDQGTEAQKTTCRIRSCSFPDLVLEHEFLERKESSGIHGCMKHYRPQRNTEASQRHSRREGICQAWKRGARPAVVQRRSCVTKSNLSAESKPVQCALLPYLCLSVTPHEYLMLGEGGMQNYCIDSYTALCMYHCIYCHQSSKIVCLDRITVFNCSTTNHFLLPSRVTHTSFGRQMLGERGCIPLAPSFTWYSQI